MCEHPQNTLFSFYVGVYAKEMTIISFSVLEECYYCIRLIYCTPICLGVQEGITWKLCKCMLYIMWNDILTDNSTVDVKMENLEYMIQYEV